MDSKLVRSQIADRMQRTDQFVLAGHPLMLRPALILEARRCRLCDTGIVSIQVPQESGLDIDALPNVNPLLGGEDRVYTRSPRGARKYRKAVESEYWLDWPDCHGSIPRVIYLSLEYNQLTVRAPSA